MSTHPTATRWLRRIAIIIAVLVVVIGGGLWWLLGSQSGLRFALSRASAASDGALTVKTAQGDLAGPLTLTGVSYRHAKTGLSVEVKQLTLDVGIWSLVAGNADITQLDANGITVNLPKTASQSETSTPLSLKPPLDIILEQAHVGDVRIMQAGQPVFVVNTLDLAGAWTSQGITIQQLKLRAPDGQADLAGQFALAPRVSGQAHGQFQWTLDGNTWAGTLKSRSDGHKAHVTLAISQPMTATLNIAIEQNDQLVWTAKLDAPTFAAKPILGDSSSIKTLAIALSGHGDRHGGTLEGQIALDQTRFNLKPLKLHYDPKTKKVTLDRLALTSPDIKGQLDAHGTLALGAQPIHADLVIDWHDVLLPEKLAGQKLASAGNIQLIGSADHYQVQGRVTVGPPGKEAHLALDLEGTPSVVTLTHLTIKQPKGHLDTHGTITLKPHLAWQLTLKGEHFNPGAILVNWQGALDIDLATQGQLTPAGPDASFKLVKLGGQLRGRSLSGHGTLHLAPNRVVNGTLDLASGHSHITLAAHGKTANHITLDLAIISLNDWLPDASGALHGTVKVDGLWPKLAVDAHLRGQKLDVGKRRVGAFDLTAKVPDVSHPGGTLTLKAEDLFVDGLAFKSVTVNGDGNAAHHTLKVTASGQPLSLKLILSGAMQGKAWHGTLSTLDLDLQGLPPWHLKQPAQLAWDQGAASLSSTCLTAGVPTLCLSAKKSRDGTLKASYQLTQIPLQLITTIAENGLPLRSSGFINGQGKMTLAANGQLSGHATLTSPKGRIGYPDRPELPLLAYSDLSVEATLAPTHQHVSLTATLAHGGYLRGNIDVAGTDRALSGQVAVRLESLAPIELFTNALANLKGHLDARFDLGGSLAKPTIQGQATVEQLAAEVPMVGLKLHDGHIHIASTSASNLAVDGHIGSGDGTLKIDGTVGMNDKTATQIRIRGDKVLAADIPAAKVTLSPDLTIDYGAKGLALGGSVTIDKARVELEKLPGAGATQTSPDVVIVDAKKKQQQSAALPVHVDLTVDLGQHTHIIGYGLDGHVSGKLHVSQQPGKITRGRGQIIVNGTFKAYGQDLTIKQGRLLFASTPIDNPGLDIRAIRELHPNATIDDNQVVGLAISGTAQRPVMTVFSNPPMEQSDALSYLITGKPLSAVRGGEGNLVNAAAQALGSAAGNLLAKGIGSKLGIDASVSSSAALGTAAFTVGKYLSPNLYLSYGVGLFDPGQVITLRYILSRRWNFEAEQATDFSRASFNYRLER